MLPSHKQTIAQLLSDAVGSLLPEGQARPEIVLERPKQAAHGDIACNVALQLAKPLGTNPRELAGKIAGAIRADARGQRWWPPWRSLAPVSSTCACPPPRVPT